MRKYRYSVSLTQEQYDATQELMKHFLQPDVSSLFTTFLVKEYREMKNGKGKKPDTQKADDENLSIYPHPTVPNIMLNRSELEAFYQLRGQKVPSGTFDNDL